MKSVRELHMQAMDFADLALHAKHTGDIHSFIAYSRQALDLEIEAAALVAPFDTEPTRSILHRSAATLALDCDEHRLAERLIATALAGNPPYEIAEELRDLLEQVHFQRHLAIRDVKIDPGQVQVSMTGQEIYPGLTLMDIFLSRLQDIERMIFRTVERLLKREFRERGGTAQVLQEGYSVYMSAPRAGSFAVTLQLGRQQRFDIPEIDLSSIVLEDVIQNISLVNKGDFQSLKERIPNESYYNNFVALAKKIAPDGQDVRMVGLTTLQSGSNEVLSVAFDKTPPEISTLAGSNIATKKDKSKHQTFVGQLKHADEISANNTIQLLFSDNKKQKIIVPPGMMNDIVRPLWGEKVEVFCEKRGNSYYLREIKRTE
ncbi:hypothetical protein [Herpetosiphon sp.]|uniref:Uncharacterized protein n=1 Tax=Herpetosiphon aurantiacus (strain ATCC 23779 / DSM 785 / 114-95) TaxID=316274 RepID=A9B2I8_HERA2|nr:hypothetical protein [Herpetosiphon sp.]ABX04033.1 conserved hypothetical protein [Herpetosiphon aurantiacus DSM 785]